jgi:excisionase family DNA binding protein
MTATQPAPSLVTSSPLASDVARPAVVPPVEERVYRQLFDRESLADYLRLSTDTIDRLVKVGKLRCVRIRSQVRFTLDDVEAFIDRHRAPATDAR